MGGQNKKSSESLAFILFLLCLDIRSIKDPVQGRISSPHPQQHPVSVSLHSTGPGVNVSLLWLHIKFQKVSLKEFIQTALNPPHASIAPQSLK